MKMKNLLITLLVTMCVGIWAKSDPLKALKGAAKKIKKTATSAVSTVGEKTGITQAGEKAAKEIAKAAETAKDKATEAASAVKEKATEVASTVKDKTTEVASTVKEKVAEGISTVKEKLEEGVSYLEAAGSVIAESYDNIMKGHTEPKYCTAQPLQPYGPTTADAKIREQDSESMIPIIEKYAPVLYLCKEGFLPIAIEDYFTAPTTFMKKGGEILVPAGQMSIQKMYDQYKKYGKIKDNTLYFEVADCTLHGSNPAQFTSAQGNLTTPAYVMWFSQNNKIYIMYLFTFGFNGPYTIKTPGGAPVLKGDLAKFQNAHEFDLEHITLELNANKQLERIFFAAHSAKEGVWLEANHKDIEYEGSRPVVFVAHGGHGTYPREGTHIRIFGFANDLTCKWKKWIPQLVLLYPDTDKRFNAATMGWLYFPGVYGKRSGIEAPMNRKWFYTASEELKSGMPYNAVEFCTNPGKSVDKVKYQWCIDKKRRNAKPPK